MEKILAKYLKLTFSVDRMESKSFSLSCIFLQTSMAH